MVARFEGRSLVLLCTHYRLILSINPPPIVAIVYWSVDNRRKGGILLGKINFGKILSEISGQYFYLGFKPWVRIFPFVFFKESSISSSYRLKIKAKNFFGASRRISFLPFQTPRGQTPILSSGTEFALGRIFLALILLDRIPLSVRGYQASF